MKPLLKHWALLLAILHLLGTAEAANTPTPSWWLNNIGLINNYEGEDLDGDGEEAVLTTEQLREDLFLLVGQRYHDTMLAFEDTQYTDEQVNGMIQDYYNDLEGRLNLLPTGDDNLFTINTVYNGATLLHFAVVEGGATLINTLLDYGATPFVRGAVIVNGESIRNITPLGLAWRVENHEAFSAILLRLNPNSIIENLSPLQHAVRSGDTVLVATLLQRNPELVNAMPQAQRIPLLHMAAMWNDLAMMNLLLDNGADINLRDGEDGRTALHHAIIESNIEALDALLEREANPNIQNLEENAALHFAVEQEDTTFLTRLLAANNIELNPTNNYGETPLHTAVRANNINAVKILLEQEGINVNVETPTVEESEILEGVTPLHIAAEEGHRDMAILLLQNGANPRIRNHFDDTPAMTARAMARFARDENNIAQADHLEALANEIDRYPLLNFKGSYVVVDEQNRILADFGFRSLEESFLDAIEQTLIRSLVALILADIQTIQTPKAA